MEIHLTPKTYPPSIKPYQCITISYKKKVIDSVCGEIELCKKLQSETILLKTKNFTQAQKLIKLISLFPTIKVEVSEHKTLNKSRGVIYCNDLRNRRKWNTWRTQSPKRDRCEKNLEETKQNFNRKHWRQQQSSWNRSYYNNICVNKHSRTHFHWILKN